MMGEIDNSVTLLTLEVELNADATAISILRSFCDPTANCEELLVGHALMSPEVL